MLSILNITPKIMDQLPKPPANFTNEEIKIWKETGTHLIQKGLLKENNIKVLESLTYWEFQKSKTLNNLNGELTEDQQDLLRGGRLNLHSSVLLSHYKAIQNEINELRSGLGLKPESPQYISNTPLIPDEAYQHLPKLLNDCCIPIKDQRQKDTFLLYSLPVLAFHLSGVRFEHAEGIFSPAMKSFILSPNGTVGKFARKSGDLAAVLEEQILKGNTEFKPPVMLPSSDVTSVIKSVAANRGKVLLFDEKHYVPGNNKNQHGKLYRQLVGKSFKEKPVALPKENDETIVIKPTMCMSVCGSIDDLQGIVEMFEEQYLDNFLFYLHDQTPDWESVRPTSGTKQFLENIDVLSGQMFQLFEMCEQQENSLLVELEDPHWQMIDDTFREKTAIIEELGLMQQLHGMLRNSSIYVVKIAVLFRMMRLAEEGTVIENMKHIKTQDEDLIASLWLIDTLMKHAIRIYQNLPVMKENVRGDRYHRFYNVLPIIFDTSQALEVASRISIPSRTANRYLSTFLESNFLNKLRKGVYYKREV